MTIYTFKGCGTCRKAVAFLKAEGIDYEERPIRDTPPPVTELKTMAAVYDGNLRKLFNTSGGTYKEMGLKDRLATLSDAEQFTLLSQHGNLVKRPFVLTGQTGMVGFKEDEWRQALGLAGG